MRAIGGETPGWSRWSGSPEMMLIKALRDCNDPRALEVIGSILRYLSHPHVLDVSPSGLDKEIFLEALRALARIDHEVPPDLLAVFRQSSVTSEFRIQLFVGLARALASRRDLQGLDHCIEYLLLFLDDLDKNIACDAIKRSIWELSHLLGIDKEGKPSPHLGNKLDTLRIMLPITLERLATVPDYPCDIPVENEGFYGGYRRGTLSFEPIRRAASNELRNQSTGS
jgi:hypothetical protein